MLNHKPCIEDDQTSGEFSVLPTWLPAKARSSPKDLAGCEQFWLQLMQKRYEGQASHCPVFRVTEPTCKRRRGPRGGGKEKEKEKEERLQQLPKQLQASSECRRLSAEVSRMRLVAILLLYPCLAELQCVSTDAAGLPL
eukprot:s2416_g11.t1